MGLEVFDRVDAEVRILLGEDQRSHLVTRYEVRQDFFTQPSGFSVVLGSGEVWSRFAERYPPGTRFTLMIGDVAQMTGYTDGYSQDSQVATEIVLRGRDELAALHDTSIGKDLSWSNLTFQSFIARILKESGYGPYSLVVSNEANRQAVADTVITELQPLLPLAAADAARAGLPTVGPVVIDVKKQYIKAQPEDRWYAFAKRELDRAGLFLLAGVDEKVVILTTPQGAQRPTFTLVRQRGGQRNKVNILSSTYRNDTVNRWARYTVFGRGGGGTAGQAKIQGEYVDEEMVGWGFDWKVIHKVDQHAKSSNQAKFFARRWCAETRRQGWNLTYKVAGHIAPVKGSAGNKFAVWSRDLVVDVQDDELGIYGDHWIQGVTFRNSAREGPTTEINLMRPEDLVFGDGMGGASGPVKPKRPRRGR